MLNPATAGHVRARQVLAGEIAAQRVHEGAAQVAGAGPGGLRPGPVRGPGGPADSYKQN